MTRLALLLLLAAAAAAGEVAVRVSKDGEPFPDAGIRVLPANAGIVFDPLQWKPDDRTDASGQAVVDVPDGGTVLVYATGYALVPVVPDGLVVDVRLKPERTLAGTLADDRGTPIPNAEVTLRTTFRQQASFKARTDDKGRFLVYALWLDDYALAVEHPGHTPLRTGTLTTEGATHTLARTASFSGTVRDREGKPVGGIQVRTTGRGHAATSAEDGTYAFRGLEAGGAWGLHPEPPHGGATETFTLAPGESRTGVDLTLLPPGVLTMRVLDGARRPRAGATVRVRGGEEAKADDGGRVALRVRPFAEEGIDVDGRDDLAFTAPALRPGETRDLGDVVLRDEPIIDARVLLPDGSAPKRGTLLGVALTDGTARVPALGTGLLEVDGYPPIVVDVEPQIRLPALRVVEGTVVDPTGAPAAGVQVRCTGEFERNLLRSPVDARTQTDAEGRFRLPVLPGRLWVRAETALAASTRIFLLGEGEVLLELRDLGIDLLTGVVLRGETPLQRFEINGQRVVDEEGRFELLVGRSDQASLTVFVPPPTGRGERDRGRFFTFPLPPFGEPARLVLPAGEARVTLAAPDGRCEVLLRPLSGGDPVRTVTGEDGRATFPDLAAGLYRAEAAGYEPKEIACDGVSAVSAALQRAAMGTLVLVVDGEEHRLELPAGVHGGIRAGEFRVEAVRVEAGRELFVDLTPAEGGRLLLEGDRSDHVAMEARVAALHMRRSVVLPESGRVEVGPLLPGAWRVEGRTVEVRPGSVTRVVLEEGSGSVAGRATRADGRPAQGADVRLLKEQDPAASGVTDLQGRFRVSCAPGPYRVVVSLDGFAPAAADVEAREGAPVDAGTLVLQPAVRGTARVVDPLGAPVGWSDVRLDGVWTRTDDLGRLALVRAVAVLDIEIEGFGAIRGREVRDGDVVRLEAEAGLEVVLGDVDPAQVTLRVGGAPWSPLREPRLPPDPLLTGVLAWGGLPSGTVVLEIAPAPDAPEGAEAEIREILLRAGTVTRIPLKR